MPRSKSKAGSLPTKSISKKRAGSLSRRLLVTTKALNHLQKKEMISTMMMSRAGCCKPDGGTCCVNKQ